MNADKSISAVREHSPTMLPEAPPSVARIPVFSRIDGDRPHRYEAALAQIFEGAQESSDSMVLENAMIARNLCHDHRVSPAREAAFDGYLSNLTKGERLFDGRSLRDAAAEYFEKHVREQRTPDFVQAALNQPNLPQPEETLDPGEELVRVFDLNGIGHLYRQAAIDPARRWEKLFLRVDHDQRGPGTWDVAAWLHTELQDPAAWDDFIQATVEILNADFQQRAFQPVWVTKWHDFQKAIDWDPKSRLQPERWLEVTGVPTAIPGTWHLLLVYPAAAVAPHPIVRPTMLDGRPSAFHFPSPPQAEQTIKKGGHPVDLRHNSAERILIPEYIHPQIRLEFDYWKAAGRALAQGERWLARSGRRSPTPVPCGQPTMNS